MGVKKGGRLQRIGDFVNEGFGFLPTQAGIGDRLAVHGSAGARGGTVLHSRQVSREKTPSALGLDVQEEKEMILIVASEEQKTAIMSAISEQYGIRSEAKGLILSLPIEDAIGLN